MPSIFIGSVDQIVDEMQKRRERYGISYYVVSDSSWRWSRPSSRAWRASRQSSLRGRPLCGSLRFWRRDNDVGVWLGSGTAITGAALLLLHFGRRRWKRNS